jgi:hypothetical protein
MLKLSHRRSCPASPRKIELTEKTGTPEPKEDFKDNIQLVTLQIELAKPFVDFIEDYRRYFGCKYSTEMVCMRMIYSQVDRLFNEMKNSQQRKTVSLTADYFEKYFYLGSVCFDDPEEETE